MKTGILFLVLLLIQKGYGQNSLPATCSFINFTPVIDGKLDNKLAYLEKRKFTYFFQFDNPKSDSISLTYRIGYTPTHFYLYIETSADSITYRDRGFINGDGFKLLLAKQQADSLTDEYFDIAFSPSKDKKYWARKKIWDYNRNQQHGKMLSADTRFEETVLNEKCGFEVLLAWKDVEPYHPWFTKQLGFNLYFAKAITGNAANGYAVVKDEGIWDEEIPKRNFLPITFKAPEKVTNESINVKLLQRNSKTGDSLGLQLISIAAKPVTKTIELIVSDDSARLLLHKKIPVKVGSKKQEQLINYTLGNFKPGRYNFIARAGNDTIAKYDFVLFPRLDFSALRSQLIENPQQPETGTVNTLVFKLNTIEQDLQRLKPYETGKELFNEYKSFEKEYNQFQDGSDPYKGITKPYRRAFKSEYDNSYQPYTIKLPAGYDPAKKYPLLVFLHGSGQDEQPVLNNARSGGDFIELAPLARDIYYCYSSDSSQKDIAEAIKDVILHFPVDTTKIIIGGFSMGGYGALRTFYEHPGFYKGVAVFAGHPDLANEWLGEGHPDFLNDQFLAGLINTPVFIYHGRKDGALPVSKAEELIKKLRSKGVIVTERLVDNKAHEYPDDETNKIYFEWLKKILNN